MNTEFSIAFSKSTSWSCKNPVLLLGDHAAKSFQNHPFCFFEFSGKPQELLSIHVQGRGVLLKKQEPFDALEKRISSFQAVFQKVGLLISLDSSISSDKLAIWTGKLAITHPKLSIFLDKEASHTSLSELLSFTQEVQNILELHPFAKKAAQLFPIIRPHGISTKPSYEPFDFQMLDGFLLESQRPFFGGIAHQESSVGSFLRCMIDQQKPSSFLLHTTAPMNTLPFSKREVFLTTLHSLLRNIEEKKETEKLEKELSALWEDLQETPCDLSPWKSLVETALSQKEMAKKTSPFRFFS